MCIADPRIAKLHWQVVIPVSWSSAGCVFCRSRVAGAASSGRDLACAWLVGLLAISVGWPFFALSTSAPLLQAWFARGEHRLSGDPYFLYAASNLGSLMALVSFPVLLEPRLSLVSQSKFWPSLWSVFPDFDCRWNSWRHEAYPQAAPLMTPHKSASTGWPQR